MQRQAVDITSSAMVKFDVEKDIAMYIKKEFDRLFGTTWHCVVGKNFGSFVTHGECHFQPGNREPGVRARQRQL